MKFIPPCPICGKPCATRGSRVYVTCLAPECKREHRRRNTHIQAQKIKAKYVDSVCLKCDGKFKSPANQRGKPVKRICPNCAGWNRDVWNYAEVWG